MTKKIITIAAAIFFLNSGLANAKIVNIDVNGLVCEFCAVTIEKNFMKKKDIIEKVQVNLDTKKVVLHFKDGADLKDTEITDIITNNGFNVVKINR